MRKKKKIVESGKLYKVVDSAICATFTLCYCKLIWRPGTEAISLTKKKKKLKYKTNAISITFGLSYIHAQSLKEIDFPTRNAVDRFLGRLSFNNHDSA